MSSEVTCSDLYNCFIQNENLLKQPAERLLDKCGIDDSDDYITSNEIKSKIGNLIKTAILGILYACWRKENNPKSEVKLYVTFGLQKERQEGETLIGCYNTIFQEGSLSGKISDLVPFHQPTQGDFHLYVLLHDNYKSLAPGEAIPMGHSITAFNPAGVFHRDFDTWGKAYLIPTNGLSLEDCWEKYFKRPFQSIARNLLGEDYLESPSKADRQKIFSWVVTFLSADLKITRDQGDKVTCSYIQEKAKGGKRTPPAPLEQRTNVADNSSTIFLVWPSNDAWRSAIKSIEEKYVRPLFGYERKKESKPASIRIYRLPSASISDILSSSATPLPEPVAALHGDRLTHNQGESGDLGAYTTDFLVNNIVLTRSETVLDAPTFGSRHLFFVDTPGAILDVNGMVLNTEDFPWKDRLMQNYEEIRGSISAGQGRVAVFLYDGWMHIGQITTLSLQENAGREDAADFSFRFMVYQSIQTSPIKKEEEEPVTPTYAVSPSGMSEEEFKRQELGPFPGTKVYGDTAYYTEDRIYPWKRQGIVDSILGKIIPGLNQRTIRSISRGLQDIQKYGFQGIWGQAQNLDYQRKVAKMFGKSLFNYDIKKPNK